jgi:hypothetical protein
LNYFELCVPPTTTTAATAAAAAEAVAEPHLHSVALVRERSSEQQVTYRAVWAQSQHSAVHAATTAAVWSRQLTLQLHPVPGTTDAATTAASDDAEQRSSVEVGFAVVLTELLAPPSALLGCPAGVWAVGVNGCSSTALNVDFATGRMQSVSLCTAAADESSTAGSQAVNESVDSTATTAVAASGTTAGTSGAAAGNDKSATEQLNGHLNGGATVAAHSGSAEQTNALFAVHQVNCNSVITYAVLLMPMLQLYESHAAEILVKRSSHIVAFYCPSL